MYFRHLEHAAPLAVGRSPAELSRRQFLKLTTLAGSGLTLGMVLPGCGTGPGGAAAGPLVMPFVRIAPDNTVTVICKHLEAGQGVWTGLPAIVAEELDASWDQMRVESAPEPVPTQVSLKDPAAFSIVGNEKLPRLDARAKSTGKQQFAIDVMLPGMMTALVMRPPRFGGKVSSFDASKTKAVPGVIDVVQIP